MIDTQEKGFETASPVAYDAKGEGWQQTVSQPKVYFVKRLKTASAPRPRKLTREQFRARAKQCKPADAWFDDAQD